jgi:hypothetical protein
MKYEITLDMWLIVEICLHLPGRHSDAKQAAPRAS